MTELDEGSIHPLGTVCAVPGVHGVCQYNFLLAISEIHLSFVLFCFPVTRGLRTNQVIYNHIRQPWLRVSREVLVKLSAGTTDPPPQWLEQWLAGLRAPVQPLARGFSVSPHSLSMVTWVSSQRGIWLYPKKGGKERHQGEASASSKMVILDVTHHHFCHVLLVTQILRQCRRRVNTGSRLLRSLAITGTIYFL